MKNKTDFQDTIFTDVRVSLNFIDRLKIVFNGFIYIEIETKTENKPGKCESKSKIIISKSEHHKMLSLKSLSNKIERELNETNKFN